MATTMDLQTAAALTTFTQFWRFASARTANVNELGAYPGSEWWNANLLAP